jgi:hypothetical protein
MLLQIEKLLEWLNPKGIREYRLKREIEKYQHYLLTGMKKHNSVSVYNDPLFYTYIYLFFMYIFVHRNNKHHLSMRCLVVIHVAKIHHNSLQAHGSHTSISLLNNNNNNTSVVSVFFPFSLL